MTLPSLWYEVHLVVPGQLDVAGVTIPGGPGVILGFTRDVAWTFTNTGADVTDFYAEHVDDPRNPHRYLVDGAWRPLELRTETYLGPRGELLDVDTCATRIAGRCASMRASGSRCGGRALEGGGAFGALRAGPHAHTTAEWLTATEGYDVPAQNMLVADRAGSIAIRSTGHYPVRPGDGRGDLRARWIQVIERLDRGAAALAVSGRDGSRAGISRLGQSGADRSRHAQPTGQRVSRGELGDAVACGAHQHLAARRFRGDAGRHAPLADRSRECARRLLRPVLPRCGEAG